MPRGIEFFPPKKENPISIRIREPTTNKTLAPFRRLFQRHFSRRREEGVRREGEEDKKAARRCRSDICP
jgi:hypothetical protein